VRLVWRATERLSGLLREGATPEGLALALAVGAAFGLFPIVGATTALCLLAGSLFRLNHGALQLANYAMTLPQLALLVPLVRLGEGLTGSPPMPIDPRDIVPLFRADPAAFLARFGLTGLRGILAWTLLAPLFVGALYLALRPPLRALAQGVTRLRTRPEAT
jgi:uncharacterized protein (DUF2062 family)